MNEIKSIKDIPTEDWMGGGSPTCAGCGPEIGLKLALKVLGKDTVVVNPAGCMTLLCNYPFTPLRVSWIHSAIENAGPTASGILAALRARGRKMNVVCYAGDGACYSDDTEVLTESGFKLIKDLKAGEKTWSVNPESNELELEKVEKLHKYRFNGKMVGVKSRYLDYLVTPNHNVPIWGNNKWGFIEAKDLKVRYKSKTNRSFKWLGKTPEKKYYIPKVKVKTSEKIIEKVPIKEWVQFLGWFISEGCLYHSKSGYLIRIYQSNDKNRQEILRLTKKLGLNSFECNRSVDFQSKQIYSYLVENCGKGFAAKKIPKWVLS
ncbi:hypothetical protein H0N95_02075, partial [Candidatus Micrarchaeota archaeon]|nr:hypothetical protein [Candidatus Micrarchaeota archaeon]